MNNFKQMPIWIHTFSPLNLSDIKGIANLTKANPNIPVILGHMGGLNWLDTIEIAKEINNIYLDTSAVYTAIALKLAVESVRCEQLRSWITIFPKDNAFSKKPVNKQQMESKLHLLPRTLFINSHYIVEIYDIVQLLLP